MSAGGYGRSVRGLGGLGGLGRWGVMVGVMAAVVSAARGQIVPPPGGAVLQFRGPANGFGNGPLLPNDGNLSNANEWYFPVTGTPNNAVPGGSDIAIVTTNVAPGNVVTGSLNSFSAGLSGVTVEATVNTGLGGIGASDVSFESSASAAGDLAFQGEVNVDASITSTGEADMGGTVNVNASMNVGGMRIVGGSMVNLAGSITSGPAAFTGQYADPSFYSNTTALQDDAGNLDFNGGVFTCNGDAVFGTVAGTADQPNIASVLIFGGGTLNTSGVTRMGVINPNPDPNYDPTLQGPTAAGSAFVAVFGSTWDAEGDIRIGDAANGIATVMVESAGILHEDGDLRVGAAAGGFGTFEVTGAGSTARVSGELLVGDAGWGTVTVDTNGSLEVDGDLTVAKQEGSNGTLTLQDSGSKLIFGGGDVVVGSAGTATMTVEGGFVADFSGNEVTVGDEATGSGTLTVTDTDSQMNTGDITIASSGTGELVLQDGGAVHTLGDATIGEELGQGDATIDSAEWTIDGSLTIGENGMGELDVNAGGTLTVKGTEVTLGEEDGSTGTLVFTGDGPTAAISGKVTVGDNGTGKLSVLGGASITLEEVSLGEQGSGTGNLTVDGGSALHLMGGLTVGGQGNASLSVLGGSTVTVDGDLTMAEGVFAGNTATGTVDDASTLHVVGSVSVGSQGSATLTLDHGSALVADGDATIGEMSGGSGVVNVKGAGTLLTYKGKLTVGDGGAGTLAISGGGGVSGAGGATGVLNVGVQGPASGTITVDGAGSSLQAGSVFVGGDEGGPGGSGSITVSGGAAAGASAELVLWPNGSVNVGGGRFTVGDQSALAAVGTVQVNSGGLLAGFGKITGKVVNAGGRVLPGGDPGTLEIVGDFEQDSGVLDMGIAGNDPGLYNHLVVDGNVTLNGTVLLDFEDGFAPLAGQSFDLISGDNAFTLQPGQVEVAGLEPGWAYQIDTTNDGLAIESLTNGVAVPEPGTLGVLALAGVLVGWRRRAGGKR
ncbi:MAG TPA: PEP-CTERM sorting domain-containing protein [Phycisphaerae bacterium]|nr:PEP-CTERM sorting domain-containing protein [Phycisphaerae bacterium]